MIILQCKEQKFIDVVLVIVGLVMVVVGFCENTCSVFATIHLLCLFLIILVCYVYSCQ